LREVLAGMGLGQETLQAFNHHRRKTVGKATQRLPSAETSARNLFRALRRPRSRR
jgi:hypothetical protein